MKYSITLPLEISFVAILLFSSQAWGQTTGILDITEDTTLSEDHLGTINILANNITLDCNKYVVRNNNVSSNGINVNYVHGVTIKNCIIDGYSAGYGISLYQTTGNQINNNKILNSRYAITLAVASDNTIHHNTLSDNHLGIRVPPNSNNNTISDNFITNTSGEAINLQRNNHNTISDNIITGNLRGVLLFRSTDNVVEGNMSFANTADGFSLIHSNGNSFEENVSYNNGSRGYSFLDSSGNSFKENRSSWNGEYGFALIQGSNSNVLEENIACNNSNSDYYQDETSTMNTLMDNKFCETSGF